MLQLTETTFADTIQRNAAVAVDFWAPWCGPCRAFGPIFEKAAERHPDIVFAKINIDEERRLATALHVRAIPTLILFRDQAVVHMEAGMLSASALERMLAKLVA